MLSDLLTPTSVTLIVATFILAGTVKGVIGLGLPTIALAMLTAGFGLPQAMALMLVPSFVTNLWQALSGGHATAIVARTWLFLLAAAGMIFVGAAALTRVNVSWLSALLGFVIIAYAVVGLSRAQLFTIIAQKKWAGVLAGTLNGILTGMTGSFVVPGVMYLQSIGLPRDQLIQAMGLLFAASTVALGLALGQNQLLSGELAAASLLATVPALLGIVLGQKVRSRLSEPAFRRVFFVSLLILGGYIVLRALT